MLVITFGRAASQELRERVREQLVEAERAPGRPAPRVPGRSDRAARPRWSSADVELRGASGCATRSPTSTRATIATTHQFCQSVLRSLGVAGDTDSGAELVESLDDLVVEVVDDVFLRRCGLGRPSRRRSSAPVALQLARAAVGDPQAELAPDDAEPRSAPAASATRSRRPCAPRSSGASAGSACSPTTTC